MGDLIVMSRAKPVPPRERIASAEILFFTGVRYYRMPDDAAVKTSLGAAVPAKRRRNPVVRRRMAEYKAAGAAEALI